MSELKKCLECGKRELELIKVISAIFMKKIILILTFILLLSVSTLAKPLACDKEMDVQIKNNIISIPKAYLSNVICIKNKENNIDFMLQLVVDSKLAYSEDAYGRALPYDYNHIFLRNSVEDCFSENIIIPHNVAIIEDFYNKSYYSFFLTFSEEKNSPYDFLCDWDNTTSIIIKLPEKRYFVKNLDIKTIRPLPDYTGNDGDNIIYGWNKPTDSFLQNDRVYITFTYSFDLSTLVWIILGTIIGIIAELIREKFIKLKELNNNPNSKSKPKSR